MRRILIAWLSILSLGESKAKITSDILASDLAISILRDSVSLELTDYMELQPDHATKDCVDSAEAEEDFLLEERLTQFSDELELKSNLSLAEEESILGEGDDTEFKENIAPSRALSVRYLGAESVNAPSSTHAESTYNQDIMSTEGSSIPVSLSASNTSAPSDYSVKEGNAIKLPKEGNAVASQAVVPSDASYATSTASSPASNISSGIGGIAAISEGSGTASQQSVTEGNVEYHYDVEYRVSGRVKIDQAASTGMIFTIADEQGDTPLPANFNVQINGYVKDGVQPTLDGQGLYSGFQMLYDINYKNAPSITINGLHSMENFKKSIQGDAIGGAITLINGYSKLIFDNDVNTPVIFQNNHVVSTGTTAGYSAAGGAIFLAGGPSIGDLRANFYNNTATVKDSDGTTSRYARGGAISLIFNEDGALGYVPSSVTSSIASITGDFSDNKASFGGAIYTGSRAVIGSITGNFTRNIAEGYRQIGHTNGSDGGAFRTYGGTFSSITGNFTQNISHAFSGDALGGAISLNGTTINGVISGVYTGNMAFSDHASALGGAFSLRSQASHQSLQLTDVSFYNNVAGTGSSNANHAKGAAIYISNSNDVTITAKNEHVVFRDNYTVTNSSVTKNINGTNNEQWTYDIVENAGAVRDYTAIYLDGSNLTLETTAGSDKTITIDDAIKSSTSSAGILTIKDTSHSDVENEYGVFLNGELDMNHLIVETGGVQLGSATHSDGSTSTGSFVNHANVTVRESARIKTNADYLDQVGDVILEGGTNIDKAALLNLTGGTLVSNINQSAGAAGERSGHIAITGATAFGLDEGTDRTIVYSDTLSILNTLELQKQASIDTETLFFYGTDISDVNQSLGGANHIIANAGTSFSFSKIDLNFGSAYIGDIFEIIIGDGSGMLTIDYDLTDLSKITILQINGRELTTDEYEIRRRTSDGGIEVEILRDFPPVPEPSTITLSLIALSALLARRRRRTL